MLNPLFVLAAICLFLTSPRIAAAQSEGVVSVSLLPGWLTPHDAQMAGLRISLAPGWKTYWRAPGEAGIPPQFSWAGSRNLRAVRLHWPRPIAFETNGMQSIGYHGEVVLPVELFAIDPGQPVELRGELAFGVCKDICVPAAATIVAVLAGQSTPQDRATIEAALARQPTTLSADVVCRADPIRDGIRLSAEAVLPSQGANEVAVIELDRPGIWVSEAATTRDGSKLVAVADLVPPDATPFALDRSRVKLTVLGESGAVEMQGCRGG
jgi:DsbC/DsbD-like thiol-disulfide interchange protein